MLLLKIDIISKKKNHKQSLVCLGSFSDDKLMLILLTEVVTFHIRLTIINIKKLGLKKLFSNFFLSVWALKNYLNDLLKMFFYISDNFI